MNNTQAVQPQSTTHSVKSFLDKVCNTIADEKTYENKFLRSFLKVLMTVSLLMIVAGVFIDPIWALIGLPAFLFNPIRVHLKI